MRLLIQRFALMNLVLIFMTACDKDYASIDSDLINGDDAKNFITSSTDSYSVITSTKKYGPFSSSAFSSNLLGYYSNSLFGNSKTNVVAQVDAATYNPAFGDNIELDSVILTIPYFSTVIDIDENNRPVYRLDSVYGNDPIKLTIFRSKYYLRDFDPNLDFTDARTYYSDATTSDANSISDSELEGDLLYYNDSFLPSNEQIFLTALNSESNPPVIDTIATLSPSLRLKLDNGLEDFEALNQYWKDNLFNLEGSSELSNANNFTNYFRGIYFKTETTSDKGSMMLLNLRDADANLTVYYKNAFDEEDTDNDGIPNYADVDKDGDGTEDNGTDSDSDGINDTFDIDSTSGYDNNNDGIDDSITPTTGSFRMNFRGNIINLFENNNFNVTDGDSQNGDEYLYLKGGLGSMAVINLFNGDENGESDELSDFKSKNWLINEANLIFYVDQSQMLEDEPDRIFLYDLENNIPLRDYFLDQSIDPGTGKAVVNHLGPLERIGDEPNGQGVRYKIRITEHLNKIYSNDSTNVKLGLFVTSGVSDTQNLKLKDFDEANPNFQIENIISSAALTPKGTVLHGSRSPDETKKVKLQIYYTEPKE